MFETGLCATCLSIASMRSKRNNTCAYFPHRAFGSFHAIMAKLWDRSFISYICLHTAKIFFLIFHSFFLRHSLSLLKQKKIRFLVTKKIWGLLSAGNKHATSLILVLQCTTGRTSPNWRRSRWWVFRNKTAMKKKLP